jgi:hypothetical protein
MQHVSVCLTCLTAAAVTSGMGGSLFLFFSFGLKDLKLTSSLFQFSSVPFC